MEVTWGRVMYATKEKRQAWEKAYYQKNKEKIRAKKAEQMRSLRNKYQDKFRQQGLSYRQAMRERLMDIYGRVCAICGYEDSRALTLDHIHGDGNLERKEFGETGVYRRAVKEFQPEKYRTLCMNCQFIEHKERSKRQSPGNSLEVNE